MTLDEWTLSRPRCTLALAVLVVAQLACATTERLGQPPASSRTPISFRAAIGESTEVVQGAVVAPAFFEVEGLRPLLGRFPRSSEYDAPVPEVVVLAHALWSGRFEAAASVIGASIDIDGRPARIVGIAPAGFRPEGAGLLWLPRSRGAALPSE